MKAYRLHYFPESGNSYKLALMLALCEQPFEAVWTDYFGGVTRTAHWRTTVNEMGEVPVLEDGPERLTQSGAILIRLAKRHGLFLPDHGSARHEVLRWLLWDNHKLTSYMATYRFLRSFTPAPGEGVLAFFRGRMDGALAIAERRLERQRFIIGDEPTIADLSCCGYLFFPAEETGYDLPRSHPAVAAWLERIVTLPGWRGLYDLLPGPRFTPPSPTATSDGTSRPGYR